MKRIMSVFLAALIAAASALACPAYVYADSTPYVALGADLTDEQRSIVLSLMGVTEEELKSDTVITVTNAEEHQYLDSYLDASVIGTRALSSCKVTAEPAGHGITVEAHNISYLTPSMYVNALATAGMKDASVVVAGPTQISGTAALVGAMKAYAAMTGTTISEKALDGANDELVATGELAQTIGDAEKASELIAAVKEAVISNKLKTEEDIKNAILEIARDLGIQLTETMIEQLVALMQKLAQLDIDPDTIVEQAKGIFEKLKNNGLDMEKYGVTKADEEGFWSVLAGMLRDLIAWFKGLFG
ncbi:MAG: DUF1002 domain-containing protein [Lachnospiraceae bacterium]|nr:DUF1002 domain-containing protein [Lachnospiraceae bacterium]MEE3437835.1 DUF1002 domain-containing protein [Lachnospiraceae bacterium]